MKRYISKVFILVLFTVCFGIDAYEYELPNELKKWYEYDTDIAWRQGYSYAYRKGFWGFSYNWDPNVNETHLQSYLKMETFNNRWNKKIRAPLVEGGQPITTVFGANLGSQYSPYVTLIDEYTVGMRFHDYNFDLSDRGSIFIDGTYIIGYLTRPQSEETSMWQGPSLNNVQGDFAINLKGNYSDFYFNNTLLRYYNKSSKKYFYNYAVEVQKVLLNKNLSLEGVVAGYQENNDNLLRFKYKLDVVPDILSFEWATNDTNIENLATIFGPGDYIISPPLDPDEKVLLTELKYLGHSINYGPTLFFNAGELKNCIKVDYSTNARLDFYSNISEAPKDPRRLIGLMTKYRNISLQNVLLDQIPLYMNRKFYRFSAVLGPNLLLGINTSIRLDLDRDFGYVDCNKTNYFSSLGLRLNKKQNIFAFKNVDLSTFFVLGLAGEDYGLRDKLKYSLMAKYDTPGGIRIRLQYFSSDELTTQLVDAFGEDRYAPFRWYRNDYGKKGFRLIFALPY